MLLESCLTSYCARVLFKWIFTDHYWYKLIFRTKTPSTIFNNLQNSKLLSDFLVWRGQEVYQVLSNCMNKNSNANASRPPLTLSLLKLEMRQKPAVKTNPSLLWKLPSKCIRGISYRHSWVVVLLSTWQEKQGGRELPRRMPQPSLPFLPLVPPPFPVGEFTVHFSVSSPLLFLFSLL